MRPFIALSRIHKSRARHPRPNRLVLLSPEPTAISETFVRGHRDRLPFEVVSLYRWRPPYQTGQGRWVALCPAFLRSLAERMRWHYGINVCERWSSRCVAHWLRSTGASAVLVEYGPLGANIAPACQEAGLPLVVIFHGFDAFQIDTLRKYREAYQALFASASAFVAVSAPMREQLIRLGAPAQRIQVNSCGVDPALFQSSDPGAALPTFLAVGRFVGKKGPTLTIEAFARVNRVVPESRLLMIGSGPLLSECLGLANQLGLGAVITFVGDCPHTLVQQTMGMVRAVVQHSLCCPSGDQEGTPVALIEAQMAGLPVVSTLHAGIPGVVIHGRTGFLVQEGDVDGMAEAMIRLARDPKLAADMGAAGRAHALEHHTMERHINALASTIHDAINRHTAAAST